MHDIREYEEFHAAPVLLSVYVGLQYLSESSELPCQGHQLRARQSPIRYAYKRENAAFNIERKDSIPSGQGSGTLQHVHHRTVLLLCSSGVLQ